MKNVFIGWELWGFHPFFYRVIASDSVAICLFIVVGDGFDASLSQLDQRYLISGGRFKTYFLRSTWDLMPSLMLIPSYFLRG